jgi:2-polyprenyl-3-methyl-5-hydroxy-6-metoxy-1,4-benzoquinol methylase
MSYYTNHRAEMVPFLPSQYSKVLEIGCGEGLFRNNVNPAAEYWGLELSPGAAKTAAGRLSRVLVGTFDEKFQELPDGYFDLVICNDVIEHMHDHEEFLRKIQYKMIAGSFLIGSVPNVRYIYNLQDLLLRKDWHYASEGVLDRTHQRFFTARSLHRVFREQRFQVERLEGINGNYQLNGIKHRLLDGIMTLLLGADIRYLQFAFALRLSSSDRA